MHDNVLAINVRLPPDEKAAMDAWRRAQRNPPSRARAARLLIREALSRSETALSRREPRHV
jgi:hypothetical protein